MGIYKRRCNKCGKEITKKEAVENNFKCNSCEKKFLNVSFLARPFIRMPFFGKNN